MINTKELKVCMIRKGMTQKSVAKELSISEKTFSNKMKKGVFGSDEIEAMISLLEIDDPVSVFFAKSVT